MELLQNFILLLFTTIVCSFDYNNTRQELLKAEKLMRLGGKVVLDSREKLANNIVLDLKHQDILGSFLNETNFPPFGNFLTSKKLIESSKLFPIVRRLPKGSSLHSHLSASVSVNYLLDLVVREDNVFGCFENGRFKLRVLETSSDSANCLPIREAIENNTLSKQWLKDQLRLSPVNPPQSVTEAWASFLPIFSVVFDLLAYRPIFEKYLRQALQELHDDSVHYVEFRTTLVRLYELNGTVHPEEFFLDVFTGVVEDFRRDNPNFVGAKIILALYRGLNTSQIEDSLNQFVKLGQKDSHKEVLAGFDLIGYEEKGPALQELVPLLLSYRDRVDYFFHAGETKWYGYDVDLNLLDAVLLGSKRIGHAYTLDKHPKIVEMIKQRDIAIEVSPISNQVLGLVKDMRNHPAASLMALGVPLVICNDDPGYWESQGLSYDWYEFFVGIASKDSGLEVLKELALNSIRYSTLRQDYKDEFIRVWNDEWKNFIEWIISSYT